MWISEIITDQHKLPELAEMAATHYGSDNDTASEAYLKHEYFSNPAGNVHMNIAWDPNEDEAAGQYAAIPIKIKTGDKYLKALMSVNTLTSDKYRGQGIFKQLATEVYDRAERKGLEFAYGMPNQNSYPGFLKHIGFQDIGAVPLYVRPLCPSNIVHTFLKNPVLEFLTSPFNSFFKLKPQKTTTELVDFISGAAIYADTFWYSAKDKYPIMIARDYEYMKFRFIDVPTREYRGFYAIVNNKPVAYAIGRVMDVSDINCAMVADFLFLKGFEREAAVAINGLLQKLMTEGGDMAGCMLLPFTKEVNIIKRLGFFRCPRFIEPQPFRLIIKPLAIETSETSFILDLNNWFFTMGDYDVV